MKEAVVNILQSAETAIVSLYLKMLYGKRLSNLDYYYKEWTTSEINVLIYRSLNNSKLNFIHYKNSPPSANMVL